MATIDVAVRSGITDTLDGCMAVSAKLYGAVNPFRATMRQRKARMAKHMRRNDHVDRAVVECWRKHPGCRHVLNHGSDVVCANSIGN